MGCRKILRWVVDPVGSAGQELGILPPGFPAPANLINPPPRPRPQPQPDRKTIIVPRPSIRMPAMPTPPMPPPPVGPRVPPATPRPPGDKAGAGPGSDATVGLLAKKRRPGGTLLT